MAIVLHENFRAVFYAPFYAAWALDLFAAQGVAVALEPSAAPPPLPGPDDPGVWWGGPMRLLVGRDRDPACRLVGFCEVVARDPFLLVGAVPRPDFALADLAGLTLATVSEVPTPWICLQDDIRQAGLDPDALARVTGRTMDENAAALRAGALDVIQVFEPHATRLEAEGAGHVWYAQASRGPTSYTTLYANRRTLVDRRADLVAMTRALAEALRWTHASDAVAVARAIAAFFPDVEPGILAAAIRRYKVLGLWGTTPLLPRDGFERLRRACLSGGLIATGAAFEDCVDNTLAEAAMAS